MQRARKGHESSVLLRGWAGATTFGGRICSTNRLLAPAPPAGITPATETGLSLDEMERRHVEQALAEAATLEETAARLGINVTTLWRKRKRYGVR